MRGYNPIQRLGLGGWAFGQKVSNTPPEWTESAAHLATTPPPPPRGTMSRVQQRRGGFLNLTLVIGALLEIEQKPA